MIVINKLYYTALIYTILGLAEGVYSREIIKMMKFKGESMLSFIHPHVFTLGTIFFLVVIILEKLFVLSKSELFRLFFWVYNIGLIWTAVMMAVHGTMTVMKMNVGVGVARIAGIGHIILALGFILFFICLKKRLNHYKLKKQ